MSTQCGWIVWASLLAFTSTALAGPPLVTNDPAVLSKCMWELDLSHNIEKRPGQFLMAVPFTGLSYSPTDHLQLIFAYFPVLSIDNAGEPNHWGIGDLSVGFQYLFIEEAKRGFAATITPQ